MSRRVLITGATGFVGPYLARKLLDLDYEVYALVRRISDGNKPLRLVEAGINDDVVLCDGDVTDLTSLLFTLDKSQPEVVFHLASQSYVPRSFSCPHETFRVNSLGTENLLEAIRLKDLDCKIVFASSSEVYGLQFASKKRYEWALEKYGAIFPEPIKIPELPIDEHNPVRPMSPYAVSKLYGDFLMRNYYHAFGLKTIVSRAFNHEGARRGPEFVTSAVVRKCLSLKSGENDKIIIGNVNVFRDWSHVDDIINGYILLAEKGKFGDVYVQGSARTNSVLAYLLLTIHNLGYEIKEVETLKGDKRVKDPIVEADSEEFFGVRFNKTKIDELLLKGELEYSLKDRGLKVKTNKGNISVEFDKDKFRVAEVPILMSNPGKIQNVGFKITKSLGDIINDQINYYLDPERRKRVKGS